MKTNKEFSVEMKQRIYTVISDILTLSKSIDWRGLWLGDAREQLARACTSIGANYIEAIGAVSSKEFSRFLGHSLRSANETQYWLLLIHDHSEMHKNRLKHLYDETRQISLLLSSSVKTIRQKNT